MIVEDPLEVDAMISTLLIVWVIGYSGLYGLMVRSHEAHGFGITGHRRITWDEKFTSPILVRLSSHETLNACGSY